MDSKQKWIIYRKFLSSTESKMDIVAITETSQKNDEILLVILTLKVMLIIPPHVRVELPIILMINMIHLKELTSKFWMATLNLHG